VNAILRRSQIATGSYSSRSVPYRGRRNSTDVAHLELLDAVLASRGWSDTELADALGVDAYRHRRWRSVGVPNAYIPALRALRYSDGDTPDVSALLPQGSRRRVQSKAKAKPNPSAGSPGEWVSVRQAAASLGVSASEFREVCKAEGIAVERGTGVRVVEIEAFLARSRISKVSETIRRQIDPERPLRGVALMDRVKSASTGPTWILPTPAASGPAPFPGIG
jgi:hypothetical protein